MILLKRNTREHLIAVALTAVVLLALLGLSGVYKVHHAESTLVALTFSHGYAAPSVHRPAPAVAMSAAPMNRRTIDSRHIPRASSLPSRPTQVPSAHATPSLVLPEDIKAGTQRVRSSMRSLVPRTQPRRNKISLDPISETPQSQARAAIPQPMVQQREQVQFEPAPVSAPDKIPDPEMLIADNVIEWMQLQPATLPPGIQRHIGYRSGDLTAVATLKHDGTSYELYLMARRALRELHVVLVHNATSYYLIDRHFQREGRSFRTGTVRRINNRITGIVSEERAASSPEAVSFCPIFLG